jgi:hypothetical protein
MESFLIFVVLTVCGTAATLLWRAILIWLVPRAPSRPLPHCRQFQYNRRSRPSLAQRIRFLVQRMLRFFRKPVTEASAPAVHRDTRATPRDSDTGIGASDDSTHVLDLVTGQQTWIVGGPMHGLAGTFVDRRRGGVLRLRTGSGMYLEVSELCVWPD